VTLKNASQCSAELWKTIKQFKRKTGISESIPKDNWFEYFRNLLNQTPDILPEFRQEICDVIANDDASCNACDNNEPSLLNNDITIDEILHVIHGLPQNKSPGCDGLPYEILKCSSHGLVIHWCALFNCILKSGTYPDTWCDAIISPLFKKGSRTDVHNYRGISLLCTLGKVFTKILNNRMSAWSEEHGNVEECQAAYRPGRSTTEHIFSLYGIAQKYLCKSKGRFYCAYVDFSRAFDSIPHSNLWFRLIQDGVHGRILTVLRSMYGKLRSCVKTRNGLTDLFTCLCGTRQGCMISPYLFILYINELLNIFRNNNCPGLYFDQANPSLHMLMFADDITIINDTVGRLRQHLSSIHEFCIKYGLSVNINKTKVMVFRNGGVLRQNERWYFNNELLESVTYYKYLGIVFSSKLSC
jgi:hypothetical protein